MVQATKNCLDAAVASGAKHFVLLSAICVQKPLLEFQKAKLKFEADLQATEGITYSIVRPTAFFKSLAGQVCNHAAAMTFTSQYEHQYWLHVHSEWHWQSTSCVCAAVVHQRFGVVSQLWTRLSYIVAREHKT